MRSGASVDRAGRGPARWRPVPRAPQQAQRQRALARTDLDQVLPGARIDAVQDVLDHALIVQKVLAEPFPGTVAQGLAFQNEK